MFDHIFAAARGRRQVENNKEKVDGSNIFPRNLFRSAQIG